MRRQSRTSAGEIEQEIAATRARLSRDLAMLDREYALRNLLTHAIRAAGIGKNTAGGAEALKRNALPFGIIGLGVLWMALTNESRDLLGWLSAVFTRSPRQAPPLGPSDSRPLET